MANITSTCTKCNSQFLIIDQEQDFLKNKGLQNPTFCPNCRQERRLEMRGERKLYRTKCQQCGKDIVVSYDPNEMKQKILCKEDYEQYFADNDPIINEPLPEV